MMIKEHENIFLIYYGIPNFPQGEVSAVMGGLSPILHLSLGSLLQLLGPPATYVSLLHSILPLIFTSRW